MTGVGEGAGAIAKALEVFRDLPLWLLSGVAISAGVLLFFPVVAKSIPPVAHPWIASAGIIFGVLTAARATEALVQSIPAWRASADARRRFHLIAFSQQSYWSSSKQTDDSIVTQIAAHLLVKNRTEKPLALVSARLIRPSIRGEILHDDISVRAVDQNVYGTAAHSGHIIPPNMSLPASVVIMIRGVPWRRLGKQVRATIGVMDDEGHEQRVTTKMGVLSPPKPRAVIPSLEMVSSIGNPIEREIVAVLQAELVRYDRCGRMAGGLGSIHLIVNGHALTGVGNDSWIPNSPKNQDIYENSDVSQLRSDNLEALLAFYSSLSNENERSQFASALLDRIDEAKGYLRITYFIACVLWKIGRLRETLETVKSKLPQGEIKAFGVSNVLMLFNGLLRYRHSEFTNDMLDDIEKFLFGLSEHLFQIPAKIAAIRTARLVGPKR